MNRKGQVLVLFVILIPILIAMAAYAIDMSYVLYHSTKLNNLNYMVLEYGLKNINDVNIKTKLSELLEKNDTNIDTKEIIINDNKISVKLKEKIDSIFGKAINIDTYQISSIYSGYIKNGEIVIEKG
jgi:hypothetical protein